MSDYGYDDGGGDDNNDYGNYGLDDVPSYGADYGVDDGDAANVDLMPVAEPSTEVFPPEPELSSHGSIAPPVPSHSRSQSTSSSSSSSSSSDNSDPGARYGQQDLLVQDKPTRTKRGVSYPGYPAPSSEAESDSVLAQIKTDNSDRDMDDIPTLGPYGYSMANKLRKINFVVFIALGVASVAALIAHILLLTLSQQSWGILIWYAVVAAILTSKAVNIALTLFSPLTPLVKRQIIMGDAIFMVLPTVLCVLLTIITVWVSRMFN